MWKFIRRTISILILVGLVVLMIHNVSVRLSKTDRIALDDIYTDLAVDEEKLKTDYDYQLEIIRVIQSKSMDLIHKGNGIPLNDSREIKAAVAAGEGECYDRSRFIEKSFRYFDLPSRHLSIYLNRDGSRPLKLLASSSTNSHALSEVKTVKGWLMVDTNYEWLALDADGEPLSFEVLEDHTAFQTKNPQQGIDFYSPDNLGIYGLYSRHGRFYKPYNPIPDYNLRELLHNF